MKAAATWEHVSTLRPDPDNPVIHTDEEVAELRNLIAETVWTEPIVCRVSDRQIIAGHRRLAAALDPVYCDVIRRRWTRYARERGLDPGAGALDG